MACMKGWVLTGGNVCSMPAKSLTFFSHSPPHKDTQPHRPSTTTRHMATQAIHMMTHAFTTATMRTRRLCGHTHPPQQQPGPAGQQQPLQPLGLGNNDNAPTRAPASTTTHMPAQCNEDAQARMHSHTCPGNQSCHGAGMFLPSFFLALNLCSLQCTMQLKHMATQALHENDYAHSLLQGTKQVRGKCSGSIQCII